MTMQQSIYDVARTYDREWFEDFDRTCRSKGIQDWTELFSPAYGGDPECDPLLYRERLAQRIEEVRIPGTREMWVQEWGRDCDMCESSSIRRIPASVLAFERRERRVAEDAEGSWSFYPISPDFAADFTPRRRDLIAEAHEDGHPHVVYC